MCGEGDWGGSAGPGGDLLFHALRRSTIGAEGFHGRVRDGIGCLAPRYGHQAVQALRVRRQGSGARDQNWLCPWLLSEASCVRVFCRGVCRPAFGATVVAPVASAEPGGSAGNDACRWMWA